jgi:alpha-amylase
MLAGMCNQPGQFNMAQLDHAGLAGSNPMSAVTFVENHDTDTSPSAEPVVRNKMLGYAYILTSEGYPCVFYRDYSADAGCYGLKPLIDKLIWIHEKLAAGTTQQRWKDANVFAYERLGGPHLLVGLNNDPDHPRTITVDTGFGAGVSLRDYTGKVGKAVTDGEGKVTFEIPRNQDGAGYVAFSRDGIGDAIEIVSQSVTQVFEGARDLDIRPAVNGRTIQVCRVWCETNTPITAKLNFDAKGLTPTSSIKLRLLDKTGAVVQERNCGNARESGCEIEGRATKRGFYKLEIGLWGAGAGAAELPFVLSVTYQSSRRFD